MSYAQNLRNWIILALMATALFSNTASAMSEEEIMQWVSEEMALTAEYPMPEIRYVSQKDLQKQLKSMTRKSFREWTDAMGQEEAEQLLSQFMEEIVGLFHPKTKVIYVGNFTEACRMEAVTAHELTHYFQVMTGNHVDYDSPKSESVHFLNELEAASMEEKYVNTVCPRIPAFPDM